MVNLYAQNVQHGHTVATRTSVINLFSAAKIMAKAELPADDPHPREAGQTEHRDSSAHSSAWEREGSHEQSANLNTRYLKLQFCFIYLQII